MGADPVSKAAIGMGMGALGGALSDDPSELTSMIGQHGNTGLGGIRTVDPGDNLAHGTGLTDKVRDVLLAEAGKPTTLGPAAMVQHPGSVSGGFGAFGPLVTDVGWEQRPGFDFGMGGGGGDDGHDGPEDPPGGGGGDDGENNEQAIAVQRSLAGQGVGNLGAPPPATSGAGNLGSLASAMESRGGLPISSGGGFGGLGMENQGLNQFVQAMNMMTMSGGQPPFVKGGFS